MKTLSPNSLCSPTFLRQPFNRIALGILGAAMAAGSCAAAVVFQDDFNYAVSTSLNGQTPDVGAAWSGGSGWVANGSGAVAMVAEGDYTSWGVFTQSLSAGQTLTLAFTTGTAAGFLGNSWVGLALFAGNSDEFAFVGDPGGPNTDWRVAGQVNVASNDSNQANTATFTYAYDTGDWTFHLSASGFSASGPSTAHKALDRVRLAGYYPEGVNMQLSDLQVSVVPEPAIPALAVFGLLALARRRR